MYIYSFYHNKLVFTSGSIVKDSFRYCTTSLLSPSCQTFTGVLCVHCSRPLSVSHVTFCPSDIHPTSMLNERFNPVKPLTFPTITINVMNLRYSLKPSPSFHHPVLGLLDRPVLQNPTKDKEGHVLTQNINKVREWFRPNIGHELFVPQWLTTVYLCQGSAVRTLYDRCKEVFQFPPLQGLDSSKRENTENSHKEVFGTIVRCIFITLSGQLILFFIFMTCSSRRKIFISLSSCHSL